MPKILLILAALFALTACEMNEVEDPMMEAGDSLADDQTTDGDPNDDNPDNN